MNSVEIKTDGSEDQNPNLHKPVDADSPMKEWLVEYVGAKAQPEDGAVTLEMIIEAMADEFPEFLLNLAEENWIRGYHQALSDVEEGRRLYEEEKNGSAAEE